MIAPSVVDPLVFAKHLWPDVEFYREQREIIYSVRDNDETYVPAGNKLGKDFVAAFIILWFFCSRTPCRIITTSAKEDHLRVLWGEINNFIQTAAYPLDYSQGGSIICNHRELKMVLNGSVVPLSYVKGMVAGKDSLAAMQGHHIAAKSDRIPRTLFVPDECSSVPDDYYKMARTWFNRMLAIGNPWPCNNFFKHAVKGKPGTDDRGGDLPIPDSDRYYRRIIKIRAEDSPNVRYGVAEKARGLEPSDRLIVDGVKPYREYVRDRVLWDPIQQCVSLDAEFYEGEEVMLFPQAWRTEAAKLAVGGEYRGNGSKRALGVDPAEGGDKSVWAVADEGGLIELVSHKTPDTTDVPNWTIHLINKYKIPVANVMFDRGGGGKEHADSLRAKGYRVQTVGFGETVVPEIKRGISRVPQRKTEQEEHYVYRNRRAQMYGMLRLRISPRAERSFVLPEKPEPYAELHRQLAPIPLWFDAEGRLELPPKNRKPYEQNTNLNRPTLVELIGHSPDEADAVALAMYGLSERTTKFVIRSLA